MKKFLTFAGIILALFFSQHVIAQANVLDPSDPDVVFTASNHPDAPPYNQISKWGHTNRLGWNPFSKGYKSYYYKGMAFRLKFPKTYAHNVADGKNYPAIIFLHGLGEPGNIWDNEYHLVHGGQTHANRIDDGTFDGFMIYPQSQPGYLQAYFPIIRELIDSLEKHVKLDLNRIHVGGLSSGGQATWDFVQNQNYAKVTAGLEPISAAQYEDENYFASHVTIPILVANGGQDVAPYPSTVTDVMATYRNLGGSITQCFFPTLGHGAWNAFWADARYWPFINAQHKANPLVYFQRNEFCPGDPITAKLGLQAGFYAYEWEKDGVVIPGATSKDLTITSFGTYRGRFKRTASGAWSPWSPTPVVISEKQGTVTPPILVNGLFSKVLPSPDGSTTTPLLLPDHFVSYEWRRISDNALVNTSNSYNAPIGQYKVKVTEQFGCSSSFSDPYSIIAANGTNVPDAASNVNANALTNTSILVEWDNNPAPQYNETAFEVYRSTTSGSAYTLVKITDADVTGFTDPGLLANTQYFYIIRAINLNGASPITTEVDATTFSDTQAPTAPSDLTVVGTTRSSVALTWNASTDDAGVYRYDVYVNGSKSFTTPNTAFTVNGLTALSTYSFFIKARDITGNESAPSNQVSASAALRGLNYKYYQGTWDLLPDFNELIPVETGVTPNVDLSVRNQNDNFGFLWEGYINIPTTGDYTLETISDDGSKLYIGTYSHTATPLVNNDGLHGNQSRTGTIHLTAGTHPIAMTFFEKGGGEVMQVYWTSSDAGISRGLIPNSAFTDAVAIPPNALPLKPSGLNVVATAYNKINLTWTDNSDNESGFEIVRSSNQFGTFEPIGTVSENTVSYIDSLSVDAATKYWYKVKSINLYGQSEFISETQAHWSFDNSMNDNSGNNKNLTQGSNPVYNAADKKEGTHALQLNGSNQYANMNFSSGSNFPSNECSTRTVAMWVKATNTALNNKFLIDLGGSDDGMALRFQSNALQAGIASNNSRTTISQSNIASNVDWVNGGWNHVAMVFDGDQFRLYVNAVQKANANVAFSTIGSSTSQSRIGGSNSSNAFNSSSSSSFFGGLVDDVYILDEPLSANAIAALMQQNYPADTSFALPPVPGTPQIASATALSTISVQLNVTDNSNNETGFNLYRSAGSAANFRLLATIPSNNDADFEYDDNGLFANTIYYYKIEALGIGGVSGMSNEVFATTQNNIPVITPVSDFSMRFDGTKTLLVSGTDSDVENLTFSFSDPSKPLPSFAIFSSTGNGTGSIEFNPTGNQGVYPISMMLSDEHAGVDTITFTLTVNANYPPVINAISDVSIPEGTTNNKMISATDQNGNGSLVWSVVNAPSFISFFPGSNGMALLNIHPNFASAGIYPVTVSVSDGNGAFENATFNVTVADVTPPSETIYMSMRYNTTAASPWNNISGTNTSNLLNSQGQTTAVGIQFLSAPWNAWNAGSQTGNNSGIYPDAVLKDYFFFGIFGAPETVDFNLRGLTPAIKYNVTLMGSSSWTGVPNNGTTVYSINGVDKPLNVHNNTQNTVTFTGINPDVNGNITVNMSKAAGTPYGLISAIVLDKPFDDGTTPVLPTNVFAEALSNGSVKLHWKDIAYNESSYLVHRAAIEAGPYSLLNAGASNANDSTYIDSDVLSSTTYYYKVEAINALGTSGLTDAVNVTTLNKAPILNAINNVSAKAGLVTNLAINASDDAGDVMTIEVNNLPAFAVWQSSGNGTGNIWFTPQTEEIGIFRDVEVKVTDNWGATVVRTFDIYVTDPNIRNVFVNLGPDGSAVQEAPWNNKLGYAFANLVYGDLNDESGVGTTFNYKFLSQWTGGLNMGMVTGDNSGIFPDDVLKSSYYNSNNGNHVIEFGGLNPARLYSIGFLSNYNVGTDMLVTVSSGAQSVVIDSKYNTDKLANLNGLVPNASGKIQVTLSKNGSSAFLILNGMVIREYDPSTTPIVQPDDLFVETLLAKDRLALKWSDRSSNENGFEIWRSTSSSGPYTLQHTTASNATAYTQTGLTANTRYYYKIRAVKTGGSPAISSYSKIASAILAKSIVLLNLNANPAHHAPSPWNSTDGPSIAGAKFSNLINEATVSSGFEMEITQEFNGQGFFGPDADGLLPGNVMVSNYWTDAGQTSQVKFVNLDLSKRYRLGIFSSNLNVNFTIGTYTVNGKTVMINTYYNDSKIIYLDQLIPNEDGELYLEVRALSGSPYCFTNAFTLEYFDDNTEADPLVNTIYREMPQAEVQQRTHVLPSVPVVNNLQPNAETTAEIAEIQTVSVYPNPFTEMIMLSFEHQKISDAVVLIYNMKAELVYKSAVLKTVKGMNTFSIHLPVDLMPSGSYFVNLVIDHKKSKTEKLIKLK